MEEMQAREAPGASHRLGDPRDGNGRGIAGQDRLFGQAGGQGPEDFPFGRLVFGHRLDDEVLLTQRGEVGGKPKSRTHRLG